MLMNFVVVLLGTTFHCEAAKSVRRGWSEAEAKTDYRKAIIRLYE